MKRNGLKKLISMMSAIMIAATSVVAAAAQGLTGDVNQDSLVNVADVKILQDFLLNRIEDFPVNSDVNGDDKVNVFDLCMLKHNILLHGDVISDYGTAPNLPSTMYANFREGTAPEFIASDGWTNGNPFDCGWTAKNAVVDNGYLSLSIDEDSTEKYNYTGAEYRTTNFYHYGYYETSMQAIKNDGVVSSFFTYTGPSDNNPWDEIDIEILGKDTTKVQFNYYTNGVGNHEYMYDLGFDAAEGFHTYGFDWQPDSITWYVDGKEVYKATSNIPSTPGKIMMNVWPGIGVDSWLKAYDGTTPLTARYQWVTYNDNTTSNYDIKDYGTPMNESASTIADFRKGESPHFYASDGFSNGNEFDCVWSGANAVVENGYLTLSIDEDTTGQYNYTGAEYRIVDHYHYGYYETSMQPIKNPGVVSSFFIYTGAYENNPWDEIDIEFVGKDTTKVQFNYFTNGVGRHEYMYDLGFDAAEGFHTYGFDWQEDSITWYVDGKAVHIATSDIPSTPGHIMMNTWPGTGLDAWLGPYDGKTPISAHYQWVTYTEPDDKIKDYGTPMNESASTIADFRNGTTPLFSASDGSAYGAPFDCVWSKKNAVVDDGCLNLTIDKDDTGEYNYTGGEYKTVDTYGYGYYEMSMQAIKNPGVVTSFFTYTTNDDGGTLDQIAIDILGKDATKIQFNYFTNGVGNNEYVYNLGFDASKGYHTYGFDWQPDSITWYVDGKEVYKATSNIPSTPGRIMMNVWPGIGVDSWLKAYDGKTPLTARYQWVTYNNNTAEPAIKDYGTPMNENSSAIADFRKGTTPLFFASDGWTNGNPFDCGWTANNAAVDNGYLSLSIDKDSTGKYNYTGGEYRTADHYGYGYYETSMQAIKNSGVVSSFFTYTGPSEDNPWDEIDIEILGKDTTKVQFNYYTNGVGNHEHMYDLGFDASEGFHTYGFDWQPDSITWYVDGKEVYKATSNIPSTPGRIMMNVWPGIGVDSWLSPYDGKTPLTARYQWVTYQKSE